MAIALVQIFLRVQLQTVLDFLHTSQLLHLILIKFSPSLWARPSQLEAGPTMHKASFKQNRI